MKTYKINSSHTVHIDDFNKGESEYKNSYSVDATIEAESPKKALKQYIEKVLHYELRSSGINKEDDLFSCCFLVNVDNEQATKEEIEFWEQGKIVLYSNSIYFTIYELKQITNL